MAHPITRTRGEMSPDDIVIAVMGETGSGKSTFISEFVGESAGVGHRLESCTSEVRAHGFLHPRTGRRVFLLDTPGFDDTHCDDTEVLHAVAAFLSMLYSREIKLSGILYLSSITRNRMKGSAVRNLAMFQELCGEDNFRSVVLATTMWENLESVQTGIDRERQLMENPNWWGMMLANGSKIFRFTRTQESALEIIDYLIEIRTRGVLQIQKQMVDEHKALGATSAGKELNIDLERAKRNHQLEMKELQLQMEKAQSSHNEVMASMVKIMQEERRQQLLDMDMEKSQEVLQKKFDQIAKDTKKEHDEQLEKLRVQLVAEQEAGALQLSWARERQEEERKRWEWERERDRRSYAAERQRDNDWRSSERARDQQARVAEMQTLRSQYDARITQLEARLNPNRLAVQPRGHYPTGESHRPYRTEYFRYEAVRHSPNRSSSPTRTEYLEDSPDDGDYDSAYPSTRDDCYDDRDDRSTDDDSDSDRDDCNTYNDGGNGRADDSTYNDSDDGRDDLSTCADSDDDRDDRSTYDDGDFCDGREYDEHHDDGGYSEGACSDEDSDDGY